MVEVDSETYALVQQAIEHLASKDPLGETMKFAEFIRRGARLFASSVLGPKPVRAVLQGGKRGAKVA